MIQRFVGLICDFFHDGGRVLRDDQGQITWRCDTCGRWGDKPLDKDLERRMIDNDISRSIAAREKGGSHE